MGRRHDYAQSSCHCAALDRLPGLSLLVIDGYADLDATADPPGPRGVRRPGNRRGQITVSHRHSRHPGPEQDLSPPLYIAAAGMPIRLIWRYG